MLVCDLGQIVACVGDSQLSGAAVSATLRYRKHKTLTRTRTGSAPHTHLQMSRCCSSCHGLLPQGDPRAGQKHAEVGEAAAGGGEPHQLASARMAQPTHSLRAAPAVREYLHIHSEGCRGWVLFCCGVWLGGSMTKAAHGDQARDAGASVCLAPRVFVTERSVLSVAIIVGEFVCWA